jgi:protein gp37
MAINSRIEWTDSTWNPVTGCTKISPGCDNCYAERLAKRLKFMGQKSYSNGFNLTLHPYLLELPLKIKKPSIIFVNSMSDLFHPEVPLDFIQIVFKTMGKANWHKFQILTKRANRLRDLSNQLVWPQNVWMGVSVENNNFNFRVNALKETAAKIKFVSFEPLINSCCKTDLKGIDWAIVGGESGPGARPMKKEWVTEILHNCKAENVPFFFKQWGGTNKKRNGRLLDGQTWDEMPAIYFA